MSPSPILPPGRAAKATLIAAVALLVAALIALTILDGRVPRDDRADDVGTTRAA